MPRESAAALALRTSQICAVLQRIYPDAHCELNFRNPLELLIATILSAQCTDKQVNIVTARVFAKYKTAADYARIPLEELQEDLKAIGLFRAKAKNIQACCRALVEHHGGEVPKTLEALVALAGVGRKTANVVLGNAFAINSGVVVDTHVGRLAQRLGLTKETNPVKIETALARIVPQKDWTLFSHWLIFHGRRRCGSRSPDCANCEIASLCPTQYGVRREAQRHAAFTQGQQTEIASTP